MDLLSPNRETKLDEDNEKSILITQSDDLQT